MILQIILIRACTCGVLKAGFNMKLHTLEDAKPTKISARLLHLENLYHKKRFQHGKFIVNWAQYLNEQYLTSNLTTFMAILSYKILSQQPLLLPHVKPHTPTIRFKFTLYTVFQISVPTAFYCSWNELSERGAVKSSLTQIWSYYPLEQ